jgi:hypothetical protein
MEDATQLWAWGTGSWWLKPAWNLQKHHASILDLRRLCWQHREAFSQFLGRPVRRAENPSGIRSMRNTC